jgi:hypothetical protein
VSFRGTDDRAPGDGNRITLNAFASLVSYSQFCDGCNGSPILLAEYLLNNVTIINKVSSILASLPVNNSYTIVTTGHSFGGALANIAVIELRKAFPNTLVDVVCLLSYLSRVLVPAVLEADFLCLIGYIRCK